jgi:hypothetical protein
LDGHVAALTSAARLSTGNMPPGVVAVGPECGTVPPLAVLCTLGAGCAAGAMGSAARAVVDSTVSAMVMVENPGRDCMALS